MKELRQLLERHGMVTALGFTTGTLFGAILMAAASGGNWLRGFEAAAGLATVAAAVAARAAVSSARAELDRQLVRERDEKTPSLRVLGISIIHSDLELWENAQVEVALANMSAHPVIVTEVHTYDDQSFPPPSWSQE